MKISPRPDHATDEATAKAATGRSLGEWFVYLDGRGGPARGRRAIGDHLVGELKLDPWWAGTINIGYEAAHGLVEKDGRPKGYMVCATKSIKATPERLQSAFDDAAALDAWLGPGHEADMREGGSLANQDGNRASIRSIKPAKVMRWIWEQPDAAPGTPVEVKFTPNGAKTTVMVSHDRLQTRAEADGVRRAWGEALDRLKSVVEGG